MSLHILHEHASQYRRALAPKLAAVGAEAHISGYKHSPSSSTRHSSNSGGSLSSGYDDKMSPSSSIPSTSAAGSGARPVKPVHSRHPSSATISQAQAQLQHQDVAARHSPKPPSTERRTTGKNVKYTVFIRLPFPRGDFEDPEPVQWDSIKDKALWKIISKSSNTKDLDWPSIAERFEVRLPFLLQQAAWLYERHFEGMKKQMQRLSTSSAPSPVPLPERGASSGTAGGAAAVGGSAVGAAMARRGSRDSRMPSVINTLKNQPAAATGSDGSSPGTPRSAHPPISRTPSTTTVTQSRLLSGSGGSGKQPLQRSFRGSSSSQRRPTTLGRHTADATQDDDEEALGHEGPSDSGSEDEPWMTRSQAFRRPALSSKKHSPVLRTLSSDGDGSQDEDDDDESSGGYLPFAAASKAAKDDQIVVAKTTAAVSTAKRQSGGAQPTATATPASRKTGQPKAPPPESSISSTSSAHPAPSSSASDPTSSHGNLPSHPSAQQRPQGAPGPLSPHQRTALASANMSPGGRSRKDGSEGSPSMGSSFSDLEDASVTQSALEDALLSMQQAGQASGLSSLTGLAAARMRQFGSGGGGGGGGGRS